MKKCRVFVWEAWGMNNDKFRIIIAKIVGMCGNFYDIRIFCVKWYLYCEIYIVYLKCKLVSIKVVAIFQLLPISAGSGKNGQNR